MNYMILSVDIYNLQVIIAINNRLTKRVNRMSDFWGKRLGSVTLAPEGSVVAGSMMEWTHGPVNPITGGWTFKMRQ
jgi:hypothetical protein